jgi:phosphatidylglycerol:prolipoprotein diacylglycerol transferase
MAGCCWGCETALPWGVTFTDPDAAAIVGTPLGISLHPVQVYESIFCLTLFLFLAWLSMRKSFDGQVILAYSILYAVIRFFLEFFRGDADRGLFFNRLYTSQLVAIVVILVGLPLYIYKKMKASRSVG